MYVLACSQHQSAAKWAGRARERRQAFYKARAEGLRKIREDIKKIAQNEIDYAKKIFDDCMPVHVKVEKKSDVPIESNPIESDRELDP